MKIKNFHHLNQFVLEDGKKTYFQSYDSMICKIDESKLSIEFGKDWDYSKTTSKHLYLFLYEYTNLGYLNKKQIKKLIEAGSTINGYNRYGGIEYKISYNPYL